MNPPNQQPSPHPLEALDSLGRASASLLLFTWLAESAWVYLVCLLAAATGPWTAFTPAAVLFPCGMAVVATLLLQRWVQAGKSPAGAGYGYPARAGRAAGPYTGTPVPSTQHSALDTRRAVAITALHLLAGLLSLLITAWWELYRQEPLLDPGWIRAAVADVQKPQDNGLPALSWLMALGLFLWWRGTRLAREEGDFPPLASRFLWATALLLGIAALGGQLLEAAPVGWWLAGYLLFGLAALSIARLEATRRERQGSVNTGWQWRGPAIALLLLATGFGTAFLLFPALMEVARGLQQLLVNLILPAALEILKWVAHLLGLDKPPQPLPAAPGPNVTLPPGEGQPPLSLPDWLRTAARRLFDLSWIALLLYSLYLWVRRWRLGGRRRAAGGAIREKMPWEWKLGPRAILLRLLQRLLTRWPWLSRRVGWLAGPEERAGTVREVYRKLLKWGEGRGRPRASWVTPREYCATLSTAWPALETDFRTITESYLRTRYGGLPTEKEEMAATLTGWQSVTKERVPSTSLRGRHGVPPIH